MVDKLATAQRDVDYFNTLLADETDANRRTVLLHLLEEAKKVLQAEEEQAAANAATAIKGD
jgi:hypothetical protein